MYLPVKNEMKGLIALDDKEGRLKARSLIDQYEAALKRELGSERGEMDDINDKGLVQYLIGNAYIRQLFIPKHVTMVSKLWNRDRLWIISEGDVTITTEIGTKRVQGTHVEIPPFGSKVVLYTHEDTLWFAITSVESSNVEHVENEIEAGRYEDIDYPWEAKCHLEQ